MTAFDREVKENQLKLLRFLGACAALLGGLLLFIAGISFSRSTIGSDENLLATYSASIDREDLLGGKNLEMFVSPGMLIPVTFNLAESIQGYWRSSDLQFSMTDPATGREVAQLDLSRSADWGEALRAEDLGETVSASFDWAVPADLAIGCRLSGVLSGTITYPSARPGSTFENRLLKLDLPVSVVVVSKEELAKIQSSFLSDAARILALIGTPLFLVGAVVWYITHRKLYSKSGVGIRFPVALNRSRSVQLVIATVLFLIAFVYFLIQLRIPAPVAIALILIILVVAGVLVLKRKK